MDNAFEARDVERCALIQQQDRGSAHHMNDETHNSEPREAKPLAALACEWHGHVLKDDFVGSRYTVNEEDDSAALTFYVGSKCVRCGEVQESELDEEGISAVARFDGPSVSQDNEAR